jgi:hypothetical protein
LGFVSAHPASWFTISSPCILFGIALKQKSHAPRAETIRSSSGDERGIPFWVRLRSPSVLGYDSLSVYPFWHRFKKRKATPPERRRGESSVYHLGFVSAHPASWVRISGLCILFGIALKREKPRPPSGDEGNLPYIILGSSPLTQRFGLRFIVRVSFLASL